MLAFKPRPAASASIPEPINRWQIHIAEAQRAIIRAITIWDATIRGPRGAMTATFRMAAS